MTTYRINLDKDIPEQISNIIANLHVKKQGFIIRTWNRIKKCFK